MTVQGGCIHYGKAFRTLELSIRPKNQGQSSVGYPVDILIQRLEEKVLKVLDGIAQKVLGRDTFEGFE
jgi:hypothetical protein